MIYFVLLCLFISLLAYLLLGGADFGAGIIELFTPEKQRLYLQNTVYKAIGPVWEANHIWLILALVILFVGFPPIHQLLVVHLHIPLTILLVGIIFRGTAFVFRHYDAVQDGSQVIYNRIFRYSSLIAPLFLGIIAGALLEGDFSAEPENFYAAFIAPWWNLFSVAVGVFTASICAFLAAAYLIGERPDRDHINQFKWNAFRANGIVVLSGGLAMWAGGADFWQEFIAGKGVWAMIAATAATVLFWWLLIKDQLRMARVVAGAQVFLVLLAIAWSRFPDIAGGLNIFESAAGEATIWWLGWALVGGLALIGPALTYLFIVFQRSE